MKRMKTMCRRGETMKVRGLICALAGAAAVFGQESVTLSYAGVAEPAYKALLNRLKVDGLDIDSASPDAGIHTKAVITGKHKQNASYMKFTFIQDGDHTVVRIAVYEAHRLNVVCGAAWSDAEVSMDGSKAEAFTLKNELGW
jgi:hypothetical protein